MNTTLGWVFVFRGFVASVWLGCQGPAAIAQELDTSLGEQVFMVPAGGFSEPELEVTVFMPPGPGSFPVIVINHGRAPGNAKFQARYRPVLAVREFIQRGYAVMAPMRQGFGNSGGNGRPANRGSAQHRRGPRPAGAGGQRLCRARRCRQATAARRTGARGLPRMAACRSAACLCDPSGEGQLGGDLEWPACNCPGAGQVRDPRNGAMQALRGGRHGSLGQTMNSPRGVANCERWH